MEFPSSMHLEACSHKNLYALYDDLIKVLIINNAKQKTGIQGEISLEKALYLLQELESIEEQLSQLRRRIKVEKQFNHNLAISMDIRELENKKSKLE